MSLITRIALLVLAIPFVLAHGGGGGGGNDCGRNQFRWEAKNICLPNGGPNNPSNPPHNTDCPFHWSWHSGKGCCAPHQPPNTLPPPQCDKGWRWSPATLCCNPPPTPPTTTKPPAPSKTPDCDDDKDGRGDHDGRNNNGNHHKRINTQKRDLRSRNLAPCPKGRSACPVTSLIGGDYECVDTLVDLDNCGGCATLGEGQNCNVIPGVWNVGCEQSACKIYTCADGYILSADGKSCNAL